MYNSDFHCYRKKKLISFVSFQIKGLILKWVLFESQDNYWVLIKQPKQREREAMAVPWAMTLWMAKMVWVALSGWVSSCLTVADEVAGSLRTGDIGPFHVG
ncbi:hypothetical protein ACB092_09G183600 [Castanea dentata]